MIYRNKALQRLWSLTLYTGDSDAKRPKTATETVVAWNEVDANRKCGERKLAKPPEALHYVFQDDEDAPFRRIDSTAGPSNETVTPTID